MWVLTTLPGSPPRMRGKGSRCRTLQHRHRITPAYAGKRERTGAWRWAGWDHPRVCGEKDDIQTVARGGKGSPPRMRGKAVLVRPHTRMVGITPAYAGKSFEEPCEEQQAQDHPRVCGEKRAWMRVQTAPPGSPPRMRGKAGRLASIPRSNGITPAYAGKSAGCPPAASPCRDHPRVCGEKAIRASQERYLNWITPAYAGKSRLHHWSDRGGRDHPRVCGEKYVTIFVA